MSLNPLPPFFEMKYTESDGRMTNESRTYNDLMFQTLNALVTQMNNGLNIPAKTTAQITVYGADASIPAGTIWFNSSINKLQVKTAAAIIETITSV